MKGVYDTLKIKTEGGMFFISALQECYKNARNKRLKDGLRELHNEIVTKSDINAAVDNFNVKFKNKYIDTFCVIIKQALESGKSVEILRDMSDQLADMQEAINVKYQNKLEAQINVIQIMIYIGIVGVCVYGLVMSMNGFSY
jgi:pilus assembly protein TadC